MFDINNSVEFYAKLLAEFDDFMADQASSRHAMNTAITAHHLYDWVWAEFLEGDPVLRSKLGVGRQKKDFARWIDSQSPWFQVMQQISNGTKHFVRQYAEGFENVGGYGKGGYGLGPYGHSYLAMDTGHEDARYLPLSHIFEVVIRFWRDIFIIIGKGEALPKGKARLSDD